MAILLWAIAKALSGADRAALDLVTAALLLAPDRTEPLSTRALLHGSLGELDAARVDIARLSVGSPEQGKLLELVIRVYFPRFDFWPLRERLEVGRRRRRRQRTPAEVRESFSVATRLDGCAQRCARASPRRSLLLPDLAALLRTAPCRFASGRHHVARVRWAAPDATAHWPIGRTGGWRDLGPVEIASTDAGAALENTPLLTVLHAPARTGAVHWLAGRQGRRRLQRHSSAGASAALPSWRGANWRAATSEHRRVVALTRGIPGSSGRRPIDLVLHAGREVDADEYLECGRFFWLCDPANRSLAGRSGLTRTALDPMPSAVSEAMFGSPNQHAAIQVQRTARVSTWVRARAPSAPDPRPRHGGDPTHVLIDDGSLVEVAVK